MINSTVFLEPEHHNLPLVVYFWKFMTTNFSEFSLYTWVFWACLISTYIVGGLFWVIIDTLGLFQAYKIQPKRKPDGVAYYRVAKNIFTNYVGIILPLSFLNYYLLKTTIGISLLMETLPKFTTMITQLSLFFIIEDILQYFLHRWLHDNTFMYQTVHKVHHHNPAPFGFTAAYAHWAEVLILAIPTYGGPLFFTPHLCTMYLWIIFRELDSIHTHCGYEFPWQKWLCNYIPFYGGTAFHDYHHESFLYNFSSRFTALDKLFDTYRVRPENIISKSE